MQYEFFVSQTKERNFFSPLQDCHSQIAIWPGNCWTCLTKNTTDFALIRRNNPLKFGQKLRHHFPVKIEFWVNFATFEWDTLLYLKETKISSVWRFHAYICLHKCYATHFMNGFCESRPTTNKK